MIHKTDEGGDMDDEKAKIPLCACGSQATMVADLRGFGLYLRTPICSLDCRLVRASILAVDVVADERTMLAAISSEQCWCGMRRHHGTMLTWCPKHGELDVVDGPCN